MKFLCHNIIYFCLIYLFHKIQQSLKEKEAHIAQILKERDFERVEFTRAAQKFEQV
jgi:hypothetical protein